MWINPQIYKILEDLLHCGIEGWRVHSTSQKFFLYIVYFFKLTWNILAQLWHPEQRFNRNIFTPLCLKFDTTLHAQHGIADWFIIFTSLLIWYQLKSQIEKVLWQMRSSDDVTNEVIWLFTEIPFGMQLLTWIASLQASYEDEVWT